MVIEKVRETPVGVLFGGVEAQRKRRDNAILIGLPLIGSVCVFPYVLLYGITSLQLAMFLFSYVLIGLGVSLGLHRHFSHKSFQAVPAMRWLLGALGSMAFQGSIKRWVADHRRHHAHTERSGDAHSPHIDPYSNELSGWHGFWHAHVGWMFDNTATDLSVYGADLDDDLVVKFYERTHWFWVAASLLIPFLVGFVLGDFLEAVGCVLIGGCLRTTVLHNFVWAVNSFGHTRGAQPFDQDNESRNNWLLALATFGDGWHNNHHRYPRSAFHGLRSDELDLNGWILIGLERLRLVSNIQRPPVGHWSTR